MCNRTVQLGDHQLPLTVPPTMTGPFVFVMRDIRTFALYSEEGNMLGHGSFPTLSDLAADISHFLSIHPHTSVITATA